MFGLRHLHALVHSLSEKEDVGLRAHLAMRSQHRLLALYLACRKAPVPHHERLQSMAPSPARIEELRNIIYVFVFLRERTMYPYNLPIIRVLTERGLFAHARELLNHLLFDAHHPFPEDFILTLIRHELTLIRSGDVRDFSEETMEKVASLVDRTSESLRARMLFEISLAEIFNALRHPDRHSRSPQDLQQLEQTIRTTGQAYKKAADPSVHPCIDLFQAGAQMALTHLRRLQKQPSPSSPRKYAAKVLAHLSQLSGQRMGLAHMVLTTHIVSEAIRFLVVHGQAPKAERGLKRLLQLIKNNFRKIVPLHQGIGLEYSATEAFYRGFTLRFDQPLALEKDLDALFKKKSFGLHYPQYDVLITLYFMARHYLGQEVSRLKRKGRLFLQHHQKRISTSWPVQTGIAMYLVTLFEEGRRRELRGAINDLPPIPEDTPLAALIRLIKANRYRYAPQTPLQGGHAFRQAIEKHLAQTPYLSNTGTAHPFFDYLAWMDAIETHRPYPLIIRKKQKARCQ